MHLVVFDIDGTLVDSDKFEVELYVRAVKTVLGIIIDDNWGRYRNVTDGGILDQIIEENDVDGDRGAIHQRVKDEFVSLTKRHLNRHPDALKEIVGAKALIEQLKSKESVILAIATGGWEETARLKLRGVGIDLDQIAIATGSDAINRVAIIQTAEARALGGAIATKKTYFGDGVWDKHASQELDYDFIAIGDSVEHHVKFRDLSSHEAIFEQLGV